MHNLAKVVRLPVVWAARAVSVTAVVITITVTSIVLDARRIITTASARRWGATAWRTSCWSTLTITAGVEAPRGRWRCASPLQSSLVDETHEWKNCSPYLNLQEVIASDTLVVHLVVSIVGVAAALILDKCEPAFVSTKLETKQKRKRSHSQAAGSSSWSWNIAANKTSIAVVSRSVLSSRQPEQVAMACVSALAQRRRAGRRLPAVNQDGKGAPQILRSCRKAIRARKERGEGHDREQGATG